MKMISWDMLASVSSPLSETSFFALALRTKTHFFLMEDGGGASVKKVTPLAPYGIANKNMK
jgi:hypothetical protein